MSANVDITLPAADPREGVIAGGVRGSSLPPGRGVLVRWRADNEVIQVLLSDEADRPRM